MSQKTITNCKIKNTSGSTFTYVTSHDWQGSLGTGIYYPSEINAGDTITFQHVGNEYGSEGAVVYRVPISTSKAYDVLVAWYNQPNSPNKAYTLVDEAGTFIPDRWPAIFDALIKNGAPDIKSSLGGCTSEAKIGDGNFPTFSAVISTA